MGLHDYAVLASGLVAKPERNSWVVCRAPRAFLLGDLETSSPCPLSAYERSAIPSLANDRV